MSEPNLLSETLKESIEQLAKETRSNRSALPHQAHTEVAGPVVGARYPKVLGPWSRKSYKARRS